MTSFEHTKRGAVILRKLVSREGLPTQEIPTEELNKFLSAISPEDKPSECDEHEEGGIGA